MPYWSTIPGLLLLLLLGVGCTTPDPSSSAPSSADPSVAAYDSVLAARLGADDYGMRPYVMAFLTRGPNRGQDSTEAARLQAGHLANIQRLAREGSLILAGPFMDDGELRGLFLFDVATVEEARALTATDPAIQEGRLAMSFRPWYGSAALLELPEIHTRIARTNP